MDVSSVKKLASARSVDQEATLMQPKENALDVVFRSADSAHPLPSVPSVLQATSPPRTVHVSHATSLVPSVSMEPRLVASSAKELRFSLSIRRSQVFLTRMPLRCSTKLTSHQVEKSFWQ